MCSCPPAKKSRQSYFYVTISSGLTCGLWLRLFKSIKLLKLQTDLWNDALSTRDIISWKWLFPVFGVFAFMIAGLLLHLLAPSLNHLLKNVLGLNRPQLMPHWGSFLTSLWLFSFKMPYWGLNHSGHANGFLYLLLLLVAFAFCMALFMYDSGALLVVGYFVKGVTVHQVTNLRTGCFQFNLGWKTREREAKDRF